MKKDVEKMNRFELLNEVERLRKEDRTEMLEDDLAYVRAAYEKALEQIVKLQRRLDHARSQLASSRSGGERRKQAQGRRKAQRRQVG